MKARGLLADEDKIKSFTTPIQLGIEVSTVGGRSEKDSDFPDFVLGVFWFGL